jgi:hypothetical protein
MVEGFVELPTAEAYSEKYTTTLPDLLKDQFCLANAMISEASIDLTTPGVKSGIT